MSAWAIVLVVVYAVIGVPIAHLAESTAREVEETASSASTVTVGVVIGVLWPAVVPIMALMLFAQRRKERS